MSNTNKAKSRTENGAPSSSLTVFDTKIKKEDEEEVPGRIALIPDSVKRPGNQGNDDDDDAPLAKKRCDKNDQQADKQADKLVDKLVDKQDEAVQSQPISTKTEDSIHSASLVFGQELPPGFVFQSHGPANGRKAWGKYLERIGM